MNRTRPAPRPPGAPRALLLSFAVGLVSCGPSGPTHPKMNLIVISLDTLRADRIGAYGHTRRTTPNLDALAAESVVFSDVLTQFTSTRESHRSLFTGRYPFRKGRRPTLAQILRLHGYRTAAFTGGGRLSRGFGFERGHEVYHDSRGQEGLAETAPLALAWLQEHRDEPFYLFLHTYDAHCPYHPPEPYYSLFLGGRPPSIETARGCGRSYFNRIAMTARNYADLSAIYDGGVARMDALLGVFLDELLGMGLLEHSVVVVVSDHGEALGVGGFVGHGRLYEQELRVPFILRVPGEEPRTIDEPVQLIDVLPTVLGMLGLPGAEELDGVDLRPVIAGAESFGGARLRVSQAPNKKLSVRRDGRWKLELDSNGGDPSLFDLERDPLADVAAQNAKIVKQLADALDTIRNEREIRQIPELDPTALNEEVRDQLRELGYIE